MPQKYIYLSPHLDDVALSCGGLIYEQVKAGRKVEIWSITAGIPDPQHMPEFGRVLNARWGISLEMLHTRQEEDRAASKLLGAKPLHLGWLDCIYRFKADGDALIHDDDELFAAQPEPELVRELSAYLQSHVPASTKLISPMGIGGHIDHRLVVQAVAQSGLGGLYYADYPYVSYHFEWSERLESREFRRIPHVISEEAVTAWQDAVLCNRAQLSTFWGNEREARLAIANYCAGGGGRLSALIVP